MTPSSLAGIITAIATSLFAFSSILSAIGLLIPILKSVRSTHVIVNQQRTDMMRQNRALVAALEKHGIEVPEDQSLND